MKTYYNYLNQTSEEKNKIEKEKNDRLINSKLKQSNTYNSEIVNKGEGKKRKITDNFISDSRKTSANDYSYTSTEISFPSEQEYFAIRNEYSYINTRNYFSFDNKENYDINDHANEYNTESNVNCYVNKDFLSRNSNRKESLADPCSQSMQINTKENEYRYLKYTDDPNDEICPICDYKKKKIVLSCFVS